MELRWGNGVPHYHEADDGPDRIYICRRQTKVQDADLRYCWTHPGDKLDVARNWMKVAVETNPGVELMAVEISMSGRRLVGVWPPDEAASAKLESWGEF